ncbi:IS30 family transposase [Variovorax sp. GrIS 2.14]|uniref:helix-turn-helix domain-containing protein n=1 Tax=Variovorax sp. GrIS 2.14 TaxID=3071709 RepID=UPI0038F80C0E
MSNLITYQQLQPEDRITIASMRQQDCSVRAMRRTLQRSLSTISRELRRNSCGALNYGSHLAQLTCQARQHAARPEAKLHVNGLRWGLVLTMLEWSWSSQLVGDNYLGRRIAASKMLPTLTCCLT